jgi:hypothetical protein
MTHTIRSKISRARPGTNTFIICWLCSVQFNILYFAPARRSPAPSSQDSQWTIENTACASGRPLIAGAARRAPASWAPSRAVAAPPRAGCHPSARSLRAAIAPGAAAARIRCRHRRRPTSPRSLPHPHRPDAGSSLGDLLKLVANSSRVLAFTGSGLSANSGGAAGRQAGSEAGAPPAAAGAPAASAWALGRAHAERQLGSTAGADAQRPAALQACPCSAPRTGCTRGPGSASRSRTA